MQKTIFAAAMRPNRYIIKGISILLIVLLMQRTGGGLYLHNWLHAKNTRSASSDQVILKQEGASCSCIDEFYLPFAEAPQTLTSAIVVPKTGVFVAITVSIPTVSKAFQSLRAPPTSIS